MKRRHIALTTLISVGHINPALGLCTELVNRGYRVTFPTSKPFADLIRRTGAEPIVIDVPELINAERILHLPAAHDPRFWKLYASLFSPLFINSAAGILAETEGFYRENVPDLIAYEWMSFQGRVLSNRLGCPAIQLWAHFAHERSIVRIDGACLVPEPMQGFLQLLDSFMSAAGLDDEGNLWHREALNIFFLPGEFQFDTDSFDQRFSFVGPCLNRPARTLWKDKSNGRPIILISESTFAADGSFFRVCEAALARSRYHVVFAPSIRRSLDRFSDVPSNFEIVRGVRNLEILPKAVLTICQGGTGTTLESLYHGVPVIAVPLTPFHSEVADRLTELGIGARIDEHDRAVDRIADRVDSMLSDVELLRRVKWMQDRTKNSGGASLAADQMEQFLR